MLEHLYFEQMLRKHKNMAWTTKDGKNIKLSDLSDDHLQNIINMLEKDRMAREIGGIDNDW